MASGQNPKTVEQLKQCGKLLQFLMGHKDADPFLNPVDWKAWNLLDYPKVIKTPMDLSTIKKKLDRNEYGSAKEFKHDVNLVWTNCMTYNADGSPYYVLAFNMSKLFDEKYSKIVKDEEEGQPDIHRPPTLVDKKMFCQNIYNITSEELGRVVQLLDQRCEAAVKKIDPEDIEIDIDAIDAATFWLLDGYVKDALPGGKKHTAKKGKAAAAAPEAKRPKVA